MRGSSAVQLAASVALLAAADIATAVAPRRAARAAVPLASLAVLGISRWQGATWEELGLARSSWRKGLTVGAASGAVGVAAVAAAASLPATRSAFLDDRYRNKPAEALHHAFITVPFETVAPEEIAFRGALLAILSKSYGERTGAFVSCVLFGLWHIPSSLDLGTDNQALSSRAGSAARSRVLGIAAAVIATAAADVLLVQLRRRSGSLLAPAGLHWALNGAAVLASAAAWSRRDPEPCPEQSDLPERPD
jgi:uncharacterized protein